MSGIMYERPTTIAEASQALLHSTDSYALSGGTDLAVAMRHGKTKPGSVVDLKLIPELAPSIAVTGDVIEISANTVMTDLESHPAVQARLPGLVEAAEVVGSVQIRNRASLAGNLCNASPAADTPPVLMALGASIHIDGVNGPRTTSIDDFFTGYRQTVLEAGEMVTGFSVPAQAARASNSFLKLGVRRAMEISIVCVGVALHLESDDTIAYAGIGLGSVAAHTIRASSAEDLLLGARATPAVFAEAGEIAASESRPIDDLRASADYRKAMVGVLVERALTTAGDRARTGT